MRYEIRIQGVLDQRWSSWFDGLRLTSQPGGVTVLAGPVADQAALHGLLAKVRDLGLPLLSVRRLDPGVTRMEAAMRPFHAREDPNALRVAWAALFVGLPNAAVSLYWALGGTWLLDTIGGSLEEQGRAGTVGVRLLVWAALALKVIAVVLPLLALRRLPRPVWNRTVWVLAWVESAVLTIYGLVWTAGGLLAQAGVIHATTDPRALAWHAYLWDPWFLVWGLLVGAALLLGRRHRSQTHQPTHDQTRDPTR